MKSNASTTIRLGSSPGTQRMAFNAHWPISIPHTALLLGMRIFPLFRLGLQANGLPLPERPRTGLQTGGPRTAAHTLLMYRGGKGPVKLNEEKVVTPPLWDCTNHGGTGVSPVGGPVPRHHRRDAGRHLYELLYCGFVNCAAGVLLQWISAK